MAYSKQTWQTGETITAAKLNHMEDGIAGAGGGEYDLIIDFVSDPPVMYGKSLDELHQIINDRKKTSALYYIPYDDDKFAIESFAMRTYEIEEATIVSYLFIDPYTGQNITIPIIEIGGTSSSSGMVIKDTNNYNFTYDSDTKTYTLTPEG